MLASFHSSSPRQVEPPWWTVDYLVESVEILSNRRSTRNQFIVRKPSRPPQLTYYGVASTFQSDCWVHQDGLISRCPWSSLPSQHDGSLGNTEPRWYTFNTYTCLHKNRMMNGDDPRLVYTDTVFKFQIAYIAISMPCLFFKFMCYL